MSPNRSPFIVHKFGGTSLLNPERIMNARDLVLTESDGARPIVVVSAMGGVTDRLLEAIEYAENKSQAWKSVITEVRIGHDAAVSESVTDALRSELSDVFSLVWSELEELLGGIFMLGECTPRTKATIVTSGERLSAALMVAVFQDGDHSARALDSRKLIRTDDAFDEATVDFEITNGLIRQAIEAAEPDEILVVPGFTGATEDGRTTTLGRSGSDYTATIVAGAIHAVRVIIWTDVAGVLSADPRLVSSAFTLPNLSYREASEMAYFGASVLHPRTMRPMRDLAIPLQIASSMSPDAPRTLVESTSPETEGHVKAVTSVSGVALIMIEGTGMIGIPGVAGRLFSALADKSINVLVISQASSEQSICTGIRTDDVERALVVLRRTFEIELMRRDINRIYAIENVTVVSVVGDYMREQPGLAGRMFSTLGRANINVLAIAQGAAETNISAVIGAEDTKRAVRALHEAFARGYERLHLFLIGPGGVGKKLLELLEAQSENLREKHHINLRLVGLANSRSMYWDPSGVEYGRATELLAEKGNAYQPDELVELLGDSHVERLLVIDASASEEISDLYVEFLNRRIGIVTPNKKANTGSLDYYHELRDASRRNDVPFLYETTAGGALPVIRTINDLVRTGDTVNRIEGVLSGSLAFIFSKMREGSSFSAAVTEARQLGKTEPDPREDLSGKDVARKLLTLVREAGVPIEQDAITVHSLVPLDLADVSIDEFMDALPGLDDGWAEKMARGPLQIVASWDREEGRGNPGRAEVRAIQISEDSPFATLTGSENMIVITSDRYVQWPMVIRGAGGGPVLTASGILSDILIAAERMR